MGENTLFLASKKQCKFKNLQDQDHQYPVWFSNSIHSQKTKRKPVIIVDDTSQDLSSTYRSCCVPATLPTSCAIAALTVLGQSCLKISIHIARIFNGITSIIVGGIAYLPFKLLLILEAAF